LIVFFLCRLQPFRASFIADFSVAARSPTEFLREAAACGQRRKGRDALAPAVVVVVALQ
jgi:hypothetical protein